MALTEGVLDALRSTTLRPAPVAGAARLTDACGRAGLPVAVVTSPGDGHVIGMTTSGSADVLLAAGAHSTAPDLVALATVVDQLTRTRAEVR